MVDSLSSYPKEQGEIPPHVKQYLSESYVCYRATKEAGSSMLQHWKKMQTYRHLRAWNYPFTASLIICKKSIIRLLFINSFFLVRPTDKSTYGHTSFQSIIVLQQQVELSNVLDTFPWQSLKSAVWTTDKDKIFFIFNVWFSFSR